MKKRNIATILMSGVLESFLLSLSAFYAQSAELGPTLCVNNSETSSPSTISVGAEKDSHLHEQDQW
jgi:hypothetical protein